PACGCPPTLRAPAAPATCGSRTGAVLRPARAAALGAGRPPAAADTDTSHDESGLARRRVALRPLLPSAALPPPASAAAGSPFFCDHRLQRSFVQQQFGHGVLELVVLLLQLPQPFRLTHLHPAVLPLPAVEAPRVMPCRRHSSPVSTPASDSFRMAMICSSLNRLFLTTPPLALAGHRKWRSHISAGLVFGEQVTPGYPRAVDMCEHVRHYVYMVDAYKLEGDKVTGT